MEIKDVSGRRTILGLSLSEEGVYRDFKRIQIHADEKGGYDLRQAAEQKFLSLVNPFIQSIGLTPKELETRDNQRTVYCEDFKMGDTGFTGRSIHSKKNGFNYTPVVVFGLNESVSVDASYAQAPRSRTTLSIAEDVVNLVYPESGDGLKSPKLKISGEYGDPRIYVVSAGQLKSVLTRLQEVFGTMGDDRLGALIGLHYEAEKQDRQNRFLAGLHRRTYRNLLETVVK